MKGDIFHIINRGIEEREIFYSENEKLRFVHSLYDFNNTDYALSYPQRSKHRYHAVKINKIIDLLSWCLMPNHSHNLTQNRIERGASVFSKKIFGGYTKHINEKYNRKGVLFQGRSKIILVKRDAHFIHLPFYIMSNPLSLIEPHWKEKGIKNLERAIEYLERYRWSSLPDLIGRKNFPFLINKELFYQLFDTNEVKFKKDFVEWLQSYKKDLIGGRVYRLGM